jgi:hypothetical protein
MQQARQCKSQKVLVLLCTKLHQSAFSSMAIRKHLPAPGIMELVSELDSDTHSLEDEDISAHTNFTQ